MTRSLRLFALALSAVALTACGEAASNAGADKAPLAATGDNDAAAGDEGLSGVLSSDMVMGDPNAPVTVIEFASVTCPHCATFHETIFPEIKEKFVDTGKAKFIFREFPTPPVEFSLIGSVLARCAADKSGSDGYFLVLGSLFRNQRAWIAGEDPKAELLKIAAQAGMDEAAFDTCLQRQDIIDLINTNVTEASDAFGISSTPSFVVNGEKVSLRSVEDFEKHLDEVYAASNGAE